jgi:hypothetical protein
VLRHALEGLICITTFIPHGVEIVYHNELIMTRVLELIHDKFNHLIPMGPQYQSNGTVNVWRLDYLDEQHGLMGYCLKLLLAIYKAFPTNDNDMKLIQACTGLFACDQKIAGLNNVDFDVRPNVSRILSLMIRSKFIDTTTDDNQQQQKLEKIIQQLIDIKAPSFILGYGCNDTIQLLFLFGTRQQCAQLIQTTTNIDLLFRCVVYDDYRKCALPVVEKWLIIMGRILSLDVNDDPTTLQQQQSSQYYFDILNPPPEKWEEDNTNEKDDPKEVDEYGSKTYVTQYTTLKRMCSVLSKRQAGNRVGDLAKWLLFKYFGVTLEANNDGTTTTTTSTVNAAMDFNVEDLVKDAMKKEWFSSQKNNTTIKADVVATTTATTITSPNFLPQLEIMQSKILSSNTSNHQVQLQHDVIINTSSPFVRSNSPPPPTFAQYRTQRIQSLIDGIPQLVLDLNNDNTLLVTKIDILMKLRKLCGLKEFIDEIIQRVPSLFPTLVQVLKRHDQQPLEITVTCSQVIISILSGLKKINHDDVNKIKPSDIIPAIVDVLKSSSVPTVLNQGMLLIQCAMKAFRKDAQRCVLDSPDAFQRMITILLQVPSAEVWDNTMIACAKLCRRYGNYQPRSSTLDSLVPLFQMFNLALCSSNKLVLCETLKALIDLTYDNAQCFVAFNEAQLFSQLFALVRVSAVHTRNSQVLILCLTTILLYTRIMDEMKQLINVGLLNTLHIVCTAQQSQGVFERVMHNERMSHPNDECAEILCNLVSEMAGGEFIDQILKYPTMLSFFIQQQHWRIKGLMVDIFKYGTDEQCLFVMTQIPGMRSLFTFIYKDFWGLGRSEEFIKVLLRIVYLGQTYSQQEAFLAIIKGEDVVVDVKKNNVVRYQRTLKSLIPEYIEEKQRGEDSDDDDDDDSDGEQVKKKENEDIRLIKILQMHCFPGDVGKKNKNTVVETTSQPLPVLEPSMWDFTIKQTTVQSNNADDTLIKKNLIYVNLDSQFLAELDGMCARMKEFGMFEKEFEIEFVKMEKVVRRLDIDVV